MIVLAYAPEGYKIFVLFWSCNCSSNASKPLLSCAAGSTCESLTTLVLISLFTSMLLMGLVQIYCMHLGLGTSIIAHKSRQCGQESACEADR